MHMCTQLTKITHQRCCKPLYRKPISKFNKFLIETFKYNNDTKHIETDLNMLQSFLNL